jgi:hypothetical protein
MSLGSYPIVALLFRELKIRLMSVPLRDMVNSNITKLLIIVSIMESLNVVLLFGSFKAKLLSFDA